MVSDLLQDCHIKPGYRSDHSRVDIDIILDTCSLLTHSGYVKLINDAIMMVKKQYAVPVYDLENLASVSDTDINFLIMDDAFLEALLLKMRGDTIKYASKLKKERQAKEQYLMAEIDQLEKNESTCNAEAITLKKEELQHLCESQMHGQMIRSRVQNLFLYEKPTREFCNLEKFKFIKKTVKKNTLNDKTVLTNQKEILDQIRTFYARLYENNENDLKDCDWDTLNYQQNKLILDSLSIEGPLTIIEIGTALKGMKHNKTPGLDGFPAEFYKMFWGKLKYLV